jgi:hypothetical protein
METKKKYKSWKILLKTYIAAYVKGYKIIKADTTVDAKKTALHRHMNCILAHMRAQMMRNVLPRYGRRTLRNSTKKKMVL